MGLPSAICTPICIACHCYWGNNGEFPDVARNSLPGAKNSLLSAQNSLRSAQKFPAPDAGIRKSSQRF
jgi:hypothetical protein